MKKPLACSTAGMARRCLILVALVLLPTLSVAAADLVLEIHGDRMALRADNVPVRHVLEKLAEAGLRVKMDPGVDYRVSADFAGREIRSALEAIFRRSDHALVWETVQGPVGPIVRLAEVQVFRSGRKDRLRPLPKKRRIVSDPKTNSRYVAGELLLRLKNGATAEDLQNFLGEVDGRIVGSNPSLGIYRIRVPEEADLPALSGRIGTDPVVAAAEPNYAYPMIVSRSAAVSGVPNAPEPKVDAPGENVTIAVLDSGVSPAAADDVAAAFNAVDPDMPAVDDVGHGTRMAMIAAGKVRPVGVSLEPTAQYPVVAVKAFDDQGYVTAFDFARSIEFAASQKARVLSLSWGSEQDSRFLKDTLAYADSLGMVAVAAAGNEPTGEAMYPAAYETVVGVGASDPSGKRWESSNFGELVSVYAPGFAAYDTDGDESADELFAGTSVSTAFVSHLVAGLLSREPDMTRTQVLERLKAVLKAEDE